MNPFSDKRGVSLPLTIGLVVILMIASVTAHELILRAARAAFRIEAADKAYFAAESGVENALYELSPHFAGYETPDFDGPDTRLFTFTDDPSFQWENRWEIKNVESSGDFTGTISDQKLIINFFRDESGSPSPATLDRKVNLEPADIIQLDVSSGFNVVFQVPFDNNNGTDYSDIFTGDLSIDNDNDGTLNEDGRAESSGPGVCGKPGIILADYDCDGADDEDSPEDPVLLWRITDDEGRSLVPVPGCFEGVGSTEDPTGTQLCEKDFVGYPVKIEAEVDQGTQGIVRGCVTCTEGDTITIGDFIQPNYDNRNVNSKIQMEFLVVSPLVQYDGTNPKKEMPHLEYIVTTDADLDGGIPVPVFTVNSDGWFRDYKQSIITEIIPKESVPLLDITIIQQQQ